MDRKVQRSWASSIVVAVVLFYCGAYGGLRISHQVMHLYNVGLHDPVMRKRGHAVTSESRIFEMAFKPLMLAEELFWNFRP